MNKKCRLEEIRRIELVAKWDLEAIVLSLRAVGSIPSAAWQTGDSSPGVFPFQNGLNFFRAFKQGENPVVFDHAALWVAQNRFKDILEHTCTGHIFEQKECNLLAIEGFFSFSFLQARQKQREFELDNLHDAMYG